MTTKKKSDRMLRSSFVLAAFCLLLAACKHTSPPQEAAPFTLTDTMLSRCVFAVVKDELVKNSIRLFGKVSADNNKTAQVFPAMNGVVKSIHAELGDYVKQGDVLATIQSSEVAGLEKQKLDAVNDVALAEKGLQVARDLYAGKLASEKDVLAAEKELEKAKAELARVKEIFRIYQLTSGSVYNITAPISGFVISRSLNQNEQLRTDQNDPLFQIAEINEVWVLANVSESNISNVREGYEVEVKTLAFPDIIYKGKIDKIFNTIDPQTKSMKVRIKLANTDLKLKPEMNCTVVVKFTESRRLPAIPSSALIFDKSKYWVMVYKARNNIETRKVDLYCQTGDTTYVRGGVEAGEKVFSKNGLLIYDAIND